jgi:sugar phosphate isomerase/epimerase
VHRRGLRPDAGGSRDPRSRRGRRQTRGGGAKLALEFASYGGLTDLSAAIALCDAVGWDRCGLLVDTWHFFRTGAPWSELRSLGRNRIVMLHLSGGAPPFGDDPVYESRFRRLPVGAGTFPIHEFLEAVTAHGFEGVVSAEVLSAELRAAPPEEGARTLMHSLLAL